MHAQRKEEALILTFNLIESQILRRLLNSIAANYQIKPGEIDPAIAMVWYSSRGCESAGMSPEDTRDWLEQLHHYKSATSARLESWAKQIQGRDGGKYRLRLTVAEAPILLTALNDHRLLAAARHGIGETEMVVHSLDEIADLAPAQQAALYEIHFLAWIMEEVLGLVLP